MGIAGHTGVLFDSSDRAVAIAAVTGVNDEDDGSWFKGSADFQLIGEDWWEMHRTLEQLAVNNPQREPLARLLAGGKEVGSGPVGPMYHYDSAAIDAHALAAMTVSEAELASAIDQALAHADFAEWSGKVPAARSGMATHLTGAFAQLRADLLRVAETGYEMIGFMV